MWSMSNEQWGWGVENVEEKKKEFVRKKRMSSVSV